MISRSDGKSYHLLLADRPLPYPIERTSGSTGKVSVCFWCSHFSHPTSTFSTIVVLREARRKYPAVLRRIENIADLLTEEVAACGTLAEFCEFVDEAFRAAAS